MASGFTDIIIKPNLQVHLIVDPDTQTFSRRKMLAQINGLYSLNCDKQCALDEQSCGIYEQIKSLPTPIDEQKSTLGFLLSILTEINDPLKQCKHGFSEPHPWYVCSKDIAFEPKKNATVGEMIDCINHAINPTTTFIDRRGNVQSYTINSTAHIDYHNSMSCREMLDDLLDELSLLINSA
jgi:hypothetical protein